MPLTPAFGRQKQTDLCELKTSLVYRASSRTVAKERPCLDKPKRKKEKGGEGIGRGGEREGEGKNKKEEEEEKEG